MEGPIAGNVRVGGGGSAKVSGLDLSAESYNCSGYAVIDLRERLLIRLECLYSDEQIVSAVLSDSVVLVSVDAPLVEVPRLREVDRVAISRGFRVMPPTFKHMRKLTERAWRLYGRLVAAGVQVIETHPGSALKSSGARDAVSLAHFVGVDLGQLGSRLVKKDLADALVAAIVALCYLRGDCVDSISASDGVIYVLKKLVDYSNRSSCPSPYPSP
jgi:predicted nuclease with RNAse H fold